MLILCFLIEALSRNVFLYDKISRRYEKKFSVDEDEHIISVTNFKESRTFQWHNYFINMEQ